ncbi:MAG: hypothetical protein RPR97_04845 [Colwellia sp.]
MSNIDTTSLTNDLEKNEQICIGLKSLINSACSRESLSAIVEELCDRSESLKNKCGTFN